MSYIVFNFFSEWRSPFLPLFAVSAWLVVFALVAMPRHYRLSGT